MIPPHPAVSAFAKRGFHSGFGYGGWHPWRRAPSRIVWFTIGAVSAGLWIKHKDNDIRNYGRCRRLGIESMTMESTPQPPFAAPSMAPPASTVTAHPHGPRHYPLPHPGSPRWPEASPAAQAPEVQTPPQPINALKAAFDGWEKNQDQILAEEKEHMTKVSKQAVDAMVELTESTLASVLSTAEALKAKLAEHKAQRDKEQKLIEAQLEEQRRNPPRLV